MDRTFSMRGESRSDCSSASLKTAAASPADSFTARFAALQRREALASK